MSNTTTKSRSADPRIPGGDMTIVTGLLAKRYGDHQASVLAPAVRLVSLTIGERNVARAIGALWRDAHPSSEPFKNADQTIGQAVIDSGLGGYDFVIIGPNLAAFCWVFDSEDDPIDGGPVQP